MPRFIHSTQYLNLIVKLIGFSHLLIACGAAVTVYTSVRILQLEGDTWHFSLIIGAITGWGYSLQRVIKAYVFPKTVPDIRLVFLKKFGVVLVVVWTIIVCVLIQGVSFPLSAYIFCFVLGIIGLGYAILPRIFRPWGRSLREVPFLKLPLISVVWALATTILPIFITNSFASINFWLVTSVFLARALYVAGLTLPFDVRDIAIDSKEMRTIPQTLGVTRSLNQAQILVGLSALFWAGLALSELMPYDFALFMIVHAFITIPLVGPRYAGLNKHEAYHSLLLDGMLVLQCFKFVLC